MNIRKLIAVIVAALLCLSMFAGCGYNPETVMTVNGTPVKAGRYLYVQLDATFAAIDENGESSGADIFDAEIDGIPAREWIANKTLEVCKQSVYIDQEFERLGLELDEFNEYYIEYQASSSWSSYSSFYMGNGISYETFLEMQTLPYKQSQLIQTLFGEDGEQAISQEDKQAYFEQNYTRIDYISFPTTDSSGSKMDSEKLAKIGEVAALMAQAKDAQELRALYLEHYADVLTQTGSTAEVNDENFDSLYITDTLVNTTTQGLDADLVAEAIAATDSAYHLFEKDGAYYLYRNIGLSEEDTEETHDLEIVTNMGIEPFQAMMDEATAVFEVEVDTRAQEYYSLDKIRFS